MELNNSQYNASIAKKVFTPLGYNINSIEIEDLPIANSLAQKYSNQMPTSLKIPILKSLEKLLQ